MALLLFVLFASETFAGPSLATSLPEKKVSSQGFKTMAKNCPAFAKPYQRKKPVLIVRKKKKLWFKSFDNRWSVAFRRSGKPVFVSNSCFS